MSEETDLHKGGKPQRAKPAITNTDRLPPHDPESEQGALGCCLIGGNDIISQAIVMFGEPGPKVFYDLRHQTIFETIAMMFGKKEAVDIITLQARLKRRLLLDEIGGITYLSALADIVPSAANFTYYAATLRERYLLRESISLCSEHVTKAYETEDEPEKALDELESEIRKLRRSQGTTELKPIRISVHDAINQIENAHEHRGVLRGLSTGFPDLDKMTTGLNPIEMWVIAARPSMGKTSLAMNIVDNVAIEQGVPVGVFSLEMDIDSLVLRMICSRARVNLRNIREGFLAERDFPKITGAAGKISNAPIHIDDTGGLSISQLRTRAYRMFSEHKIGLFVVDYLQMLHATMGKKRFENRQQEVSEISKGLKEMAKELKVPVIVLSQLNRNVEQDNKNRKPKLSDLRESGSIEQDADLVGLLYKEKKEDDEKEDEEAVSVNLNVAKQRNGPSGDDVHLTFLKGFTRFESAAKVSSEDYDQTEPLPLTRTPHVD